MTALARTTDRSSDEQLAISGIVPAFRMAMRRLASGVTIVTTQHKGRRFGMVATAVSSLAMDPPSLLVCVNRSASIHVAMRPGQTFCVNILHGSDRSFCEEFAALPTERRFDLGDWASGPQDTPYLRKAQASVFCRIGPTMIHGTHAVIVGNVIESTIDDDVAPLIFVDGHYVDLN